MTPMRMLHPNRILVYSILLNIPINYPTNYFHPMALLPSIASHPSNIADLFTKPLSRHRFAIAATTLIGVDPITPTATSVATVASAHLAPTVVAVASDSVPTTSSLPIVLDTGSSSSRAPSALDFLPVAHAAYGLFRPPISVVSKALASKALASTVDPYTLITGEDAIDLDLSCPDIDSDYIDSDSGPSFTKVSIDIRQFGTASLTFIYSKSSSELLHIFVDPNQIDWLHWVPLPRLTPTESYFHIFGRDYIQAFALFHLIPIWIALVSALLQSE